jgi:hypothetical protein
MDFFSFCQKWQIYIHENLLMSLIFARLTTFPLFLLKVFAVLMGQKKNLVHTNVHVLYAACLP